MITVWQIKDFLSSRGMKQKCLGSYFSLESAENKLGWFFVHNYCHIERF